ncbi:MAG: xylan 1,4-beta-xylosidase [Solirubrobacteraceae bacterium]|nr:xylan 1,4-beta-xylosidase [Solirubrobacteraceae bacterium]
MAVSSPRALVLILALGATALAPATPTAAQAPAGAPAIGGDFPDPSVVRVGDSYFASATSGEWAPTFALERSSDLVNWTAIGALFDRPPAWSSGVYWAPDLSIQDGRIRAYFTARRIGAKPCIGVAIAAGAAGPYHDRGPLLCPPGGAIDPHVAEVAPGRRMLVYKQMGVGAPLRIVALSRDGLRVSGRAVAVLRPDRPWERGVTENPFLVHRPDGYYLFYSGGTCCRPPCSYAVGVARAPSPQGPYVKLGTDPILRGGERFMCPGGESVVAGPAGGTVLAYHAYDRADPGLGRQMLVDALTWRSDGWPQVSVGGVPTVQATSALVSGQRPPQAIADDFAGRTLAPGWQWPFDRRPAFTVGDGLTLRVVPGDQMATFAARQAPFHAFTATTAVRRRGMRALSTASLALSRADGDRAVGIGVSTTGVTVWRRVGSRRAVLFSGALPGAATVRLRFVVPGDGSAQPQTSVGPTAWRDVGGPVALPPGIDGTRVVLAGRGRRGDAVRFASLRIDPAGA